MVWISRQTLPAVLVSTLNSPLRRHRGVRVTSVERIAAPCRSPSHATVTSLNPVGEGGVKITWLGIRHEIGREKIFLNLDKHTFVQQTFFFFLIKRSK